MLFQEYAHGTKKITHTLQVFWYLKVIQLTKSTLCERITSVSK